MSLFTVLMGLGVYLFCEPQLQLIVLLLVHILSTYGVQAMSFSGGFGHCRPSRALIDDCQICS